jgi:hypothetical protein
MGRHYSLNVVEAEFSEVGLPEFTILETTGQEDLADGLILGPLLKRSVLGESREYGCLFSLSLSFTS